MIALEVVSPEADGVSVTARRLNHYGYSVIELEGQWFDPPGGRGQRWASRDEALRSAEDMFEVELNRGLQLTIPMNSEPAEYRGFRPAILG